MNPDDRVLVAVMTSPRDLATARDEGWYRIPRKRAPKGIHAEYLAFYFNRAFGDQKWAIHWYARIMGHELVRRRDLPLSEPDHPRANQLYYKMQLGPLKRLERPIVSLRWRRVTFIHTTWDRFLEATEINDLFVEGAPYVDRLFYALREAGIFPEREYRVREGGAQYRVDLYVPCQAGAVAVVVGDRPAPATALRLEPNKVADDPTGCAVLVRDWVEQQGGVSPVTGDEASV